MAVANRLGCASRGKLEREERRRPLGARSPLQPRNAAISPGHGSAVRAQQESSHIPSAWFQFDWRDSNRQSGARLNSSSAFRRDLLRVRYAAFFHRRVVSGSGENSTTNQIILWQSDQNVPSGALAPGPLGSAIPVDFSIPADTAITNHDNPRDQILWLLHAQADVPGVDYSDDFEIPVFRGASSPEVVRDSESSTFSSANSSGFATPRDEDSSDVAQPAHAKVVVGMGSGGTDFYFPPLRNPGRALILLLVTVIWTAVVYLMYQKNAPVFFLIAFGFCGLLLIVGTLHVMFGSARITVRSGEISSRTGIFGLGRTRQIPSSEVASILPVVSAQQGTSSGNTLHAIRMRLKDGRKITLADEIDSRQEARWVVAQIETLAGLKLDTHVEVDLPLGVNAQLPGQSAGQVFTSARRPTSSAASIAVFFAMVAVMIVLRAPDGCGRGTLGCTSRAGAS